MESKTNFMCHMCPRKSGGSSAPHCPPQLLQQRVYTTRKDMSDLDDFEGRLMNSFFARLKGPTPSDPETRDALRDTLEASKKLARLYGGDVGAKALAAMDKYMQLHGFEEATSENPLKRCTPDQTLEPVCSPPAPEAPEAPLRAPAEEDDNTSENPLKRCKHEQTL